MKYGNGYPTMCPPEEAKAIEGNFYRLCDNAEPSEKDFLTHFDLGNIPKGMECTARALSFFDDLSAAKNVTRKFKKLKNKIPVLFEIDSTQGIGVLEGHHLNLWEFSDANFLDRQIIESGGE